MIVHTIRLPCEYGQTIKVVPLFDTHIGNRFSDTLQLIRDLAKIDSDTYILTGGDLLDSIVVTDKRYLKSADGTEISTDDVLNAQVQRAYDILNPYRSRIWGIGQGNHEQTVVKRCSVNPSKWLAERLDVPFLGYSYLLRLILRGEQGGGRTVNFRIHHGWGGGSRTQGADLTKYSKDLQHWDCDIFCYGHVHRKQADKVPRLGAYGAKLISKPKLMCLCGTYLKTLSPTTDPTYSEERGYPPVELGHLTINIRIQRKWVEYWVEI